jgi:hypothetical protein
VPAIFGGCSLGVDTKEYAPLVVNEPIAGAFAAAATTALRAMVRRVTVIASGTCLLLCLKSILW